MNIISAMKEVVADPEKAFVDVTPQGKCNWLFSDIETGEVVLSRASGPAKKLDVLEADCMFMDFKEA